VIIGLFEKKEADMKELACKDIGVQCDFAARGKTPEEVLEKVAAHAKKAHDIKKVTKEYLDSWRKKIHEAA
jgi:predicted small metal-binding protein